MALRTIPIRRIGNRDNLFMGGDRELVMLAGLVSGALIFSAQELKAFIFGVLLWFFSLYFLRLMGKSDPNLRKIYMRHRIYAAYYSARSQPARENSANQEKQYK